MTHDSDPPHPSTHGRAHLLRLRILQELLRDPAIALVKADRDQHTTSQTDKPLARRPPKHATRGLLAPTRAGTTLRRAKQDRHRDRTQTRIHHPARSGRDTLNPL